MDVGLKGVFDIFNHLRIPCDALIVPAFFIYVNSYLQNNNSTRLISLLSIPFFISLIFNLIIFFKLFFTSESFRTINIFLEWLSLIFNLILIICIIIRIKSYEKNNKVYKKDNVKVETKWLKQILYIGGVMCLFWFAEIIYMQSKYHTGGLSIYYPLWISISFLVYWISYVGIFNTKIYNERIHIRELNINEVRKNTLKKDIQKKTNPVLFEEISAWISNNKIYLNPDLNLNLIADEFNISKNYVSKLFNVNSNLNFNEYINTLRVEEAKKMLADKDFNNYTIIAIGLESGFNSKSNFYTAFKKVVGRIPTKYRNMS